MVAAAVPSVAMAAEVALAVALAVIRRDCSEGAVVVDMPRVASARAGNEVGAGAGAGAGAGVGVGAVNGDTGPTSAAMAPVARAGTRIRAETGLVTGVRPKVGVGVCGLVMADRSVSKVRRAVVPPLLALVAMSERRSASKGVGLWAVGG